MHQGHAVQDCFVSWHCTALLSLHTRRIDQAWIL